MSKMKTALFEFVIPFTVAQLITIGIVAGMTYLWLR